MQKITIPKNKTHDILAVLNRKSSDLKVVVLHIRKRKIPFIKGDSVKLYYWNLNNKLRLLAIVKCKAVSNQDDGSQMIMLRTTYDRKYYLNHLVKKDGFKLKLEQTAKTVLIPPDQVQDSLKSPALQELSQSYNYGIQFTML